MNENHEPIRKIKLGGILGKKFVKEFHYRARDIPHAIRALKGQFPGFERFMNEAQLRGLTFAVFVGSKNVSEEVVDMTKGADDIRIIPVIIGSKRGGMFQTILGAALIAASFIPFLAPISPYLMMAGTSMLMGGVVQMLSPQPGGLSVGQEADNKPSYAFGGPVNSTAQGNPVGVLYGEREIGGAIISAGIYAEEQQ
ncbi:tail assembly protein [Serratia fonticola]|uniref:tail assembly protein n=1 Tax=Serratia fonticola TaxID=47917 RepID=UPI0027FB81FD|nr:tail assembly protein [Serratia fonticola]MDQ7207419.1 tail assembly protein [Serratia fonticola]HBE9077654.1 tail assembly protein [Serratia fonticola]HBE9088225.1 tail assembly protein [Serratia fonticola]HBE9150383.1 tail assembly protein [Serratia fonticola]